MVAKYRDDGVRDMRWTVGRILTAGFAEVLALLTIVSGVSIWRMTIMEREAIEVRESYMPKAMYIGDIKADLLDIERSALRSVLAADAEDPAS